MDRMFEKVPRPVDVRLPPLAPVKKRFVVEPVVVKKFVLVLFVVVDWSPVKFWRVVEPVMNRVPN
jgi:hypothetical protein